jgi:hypothetical protein
MKIRNLRRRYREWCRKVEDPNYEPAWQEPLEWMSIGALMMEIFLLCIL